MTTALPRSTTRPTGLPTVTIEATTDPARWKAAAQASGQAVTPFHEHGFLKLAAGMTGTDFQPLVVRSGGADVGVAPWLSRRRGPVTTVNALPFPYGGPLVPELLMVPTLTALRRRARSARAVRQEFDLSPSTAFDLAALPATGFRVELAETYLLNATRGEEELLAGTTQACRKSLRKAERDGVQVVSSCHDGQTLARVLGSVFSARDLPSPYPHHFPPTVGALEAAGVGVRWTVAVLDGVELGSLLSVSAGGVVLVWLGGVLPEHRSTRANVPLYWDAIRWAHRQGAHTLDMVGVPDEGIRRFKSQFGGTLHSYPRLHWTAPGLTAATGLARRVGSRLHR
jgi:hypothetical protein